MTPVEINDVAILVQRAQMNLAGSVVLPLDLATKLLAELVRRPETVYVPWTVGDEQ